MHAHQCASAPVSHIGSVNGAEHEGVHAHQCACAPVSHICRHEVLAEHGGVHAH